MKKEVIIGDCVDLLVAELKKKKIKLPDDYQLAREAVSEVLFIESAHGAGDLFDEIQHEFERIIMADSLLTFRLVEKEFKILI